MSLVNDALKRAKESHDQQAPQPTATPTPSANLGPAPRGSRLWIFALLAFLAALGLAIGGVVYLKKQNQLDTSAANPALGFFAKLKEKFTRHNSQAAAATNREPTGPHIVIITKTQTNISEQTKSGHFEPFTPPPAPTPVVAVKPTNVPATDSTKTNSLVVDNSKLALLPEVAIPAAPKTVQLPEAIKLQGILYSATRPAAILNGRTVFVGDRISDMTVISIRPKEVTVLYKTNPIVIKLP
ncbi:MAG: hypothetical protein RL380_273 [Verrucomicrobiota bacterium]|jgi:hypothetical protein